MGGAKEGVASTARTTPEMVKKSEEVRMGVKVFVGMGLVQHGGGGGGGDNIDYTFLPHAHP